MIKSLGKVVIASGGTPVRLTVNQADPTLRQAAQTIRVQALPANAGVVNVQVGVGDDRTNLAHSVALLGKPTAATGPSFDVANLTVYDIPNGLDASTLYINGATSDGVIVTLLGN